MQTNRKRPGQPAAASCASPEPEVIVRPSRTLDLTDLLRQTLEHLEKTHDLPPDDPTLVELKRWLVTAIAELRIARNGKSRAA